MNRAGEAAVALAAAVVLGGTIGWLLRGGGGDNSSGASTAVGTSASVSVSVNASPPVSSAAGSAASTTPETSTPSGPAGSPGPSFSSIPGSPSSSVVVTAGSVTVTATPSSAGKYEPIEISGSAAGVTPGTTLQFTRQGGDTLATTQVGKAGAYRLTVKLGRSGTFVVQAVDGPTVLASSAPFTLTVH